MICWPGWGEIANRLLPAENHRQARFREGHKLPRAGFFMGRKQGYE